MAKVETAPDRLPRFVDFPGYGSGRPTGRGYHGTFIGYLIAGSPGAMLATVGIFLPAFLFVLASSPLIPRMRRSRWVSGFLDGVNVASLGLMAAVTWQLGRSALIDGVTTIVALISALLIVNFKFNSAWLVLGGGVVEFAMRLLWPV